MTDQTPPPFDLVVRPCTIHAGRYRWDIREGGTPIQTSMDSFASEQEAHTDGIREFEKLKQNS
jgi:hypothetical protein